MDLTSPRRRREAVPTGARAPSCPAGPAPAARARTGPDDRDSPRPLPLATARYRSARRGLWRSVDNPVLPASRPGRHRAPRRPGRLGRATLAVVAAGAPVVPAALLAAPAAHADTDWDELAQCESGGDWGTN